MYLFPAVALMAAAPRELHINIEERPLLETQVQHLTLITWHLFWSYYLTWIVFRACVCVYECVFTDSIVTFSLCTASQQRLTKWLHLFHAVYVWNKWCKQVLGLSFRWPLFNPSRESKNHLTFLLSKFECPDHLEVGEQSLNPLISIMSISFAHSSPSCDLELCRVI